MSNDQVSKTDNQVLITSSQAPKRKFNRHFLMIGVFLIILCLIILNFWREIMTPLDKSGLVREKEFLIERGETLTKIAKNLEKEELIKNRFYFIFYVLSKNWSKELQAGKYLFSQSLSIPQIAEKIVKGEVIPREIVITIPEGWRIEKIQEKFSILNFQFSITDFKVSDFKEKYEFLRDVPQGATLEGFLFPDTYKFYPEATGKEIIKKMLDNFDKKLLPELREEIFRQKKTIYEIVILASLLEKEVQTFEDKIIVSGIFWKRLMEGRPLESCATIAYILNLDKWRYSYEDTRKPSPYNTYLNLGLPPGPICNPGLDSIKAAIFPKDSPYNFFLTDPETGKTIFSKTLEEHGANKAKYFR